MNYEWLGIALGLFIWLIGFDTGRRIGRRNERRKAETKG